jgi:type I restriction enzyme R subunit
LQQYVFVQRLPRDQEIVDALDFTPRILERKNIVQRIAAKIKIFVDTFYEGMG